MSGNVSAERSSRTLLGVGHAARQHDIPPRVEPGHFGLPDEASSMLHLLRHHTIAGFYLPFLSHQEQSQVAASFWTTQPHARRRCDGSSRTIRPRHSLKACLECEFSDKQRLGRAYWHVEHQWPLSTMCVAHNRSLCQFEGMHRRWLLPGLESLRHSVEYSPQRHSRRTLAQWQSFWPSWELESHKPRPWTSRGFAKRRFPCLRNLASCTTHGRRDTLA